MRIPIITLKKFFVVFLSFVLSVYSFSGCKIDSKVDISREENSINSIDSFESQHTFESIESFDSEISFEVQSSNDSLQSEEFSDGDLESSLEQSDVYSEVIVSEESLASDNSEKTSSVESEQSSESVAPSVPKDPYEPITPIPEYFTADPIDSFFNDSVFIGYSIMMHFGKYVNQWRIEIDETIMGDSIFCCAVGENFTNNRKNNVLTQYQGESYKFEELPKATNSSTMYIGLMPFSELRFHSLEGAVDESILGIESIRESNPDLKIVILSGTYNTGTYATGALNPETINNENIRVFNIEILKYCNENNIDFVDVSTAMLDGRGYMPVKYSSDRDYHIKKNPYKIWVNILRDYADKKQNGTWKNIETMPPLVSE